MIVRAIFLFFLAGFAEIGGGYLIWQWLKNGKPLWVGIIGAVIMILYGVLATRQEFSFGRTYAAYGGIFIAMAVLWGWFIDKRFPDMSEWIGAGICMVGVAVMLVKK
ncbi:small multidrug resistance family-3 protein [Alicyclobacillus cycloheptanicus]|uniref:Small multidrug resistance family-3 protein n=1 Tax=Alicyclobacillus cycloheptanicus TaxID=1457 RepID=A0ABT9XFU9_9BACL|nr:small multidrug resistance family-3 protein [Alicyclobacillus cycloheptanicus]